MSTTTTVLSLVKNADGDNARTALSTNLPANMDTLDALFHATTGHDHTGTGTKGTLIPNAALAAEAWTDFTPVFFQGYAVAATLNSMRYQLRGKTVTWQFNITVADAAASAGSAMDIRTIPAAIRPAATSIGLVCGAGNYVDAGVMYPLVALFTTDDVLRFYAVGSVTYQFGTSPGITAAVGDSLTGTVTYEAS